MPESPRQHLVRIGTDKTKPVLSKSQKEFNRLTASIEKLGNQLQSLREAALHIQQRVQSDYRPLLEQYNHLRADLVRLFDRAHASNQYTKTETKKLADLIRNLAFELISEHGFTDLKAIYDRHDKDGFDKTNTEADEQTAELMKEMMGAMFGVDFEPDADVSDPQKMQAYLQEKLSQQEAAEAERRQQAADRRAQKPKTAKQQEREAKKLAEERNITKAVRMLYMDLVKAFHPDREPDETEKQRKTEIMHRVTEAYEKSDLLTLLRLQLEFERIDQTHLETLAEDQLKYYNKILRQQSQELADEFDALQNELAAITGKPAFAVSSPVGLEVSLNGDIAQLKRDIKHLKAELKDFANSGPLKQWLKTYRIEKPTDFTFFDLP